MTRDGVTRGLSVDPSESPYRLPTIANARFGVMLRNPKGEAQPTAFAPLLGQTDSRFEAGQSATFAVRPLLVSGDWYQAFTEAARSLFGFNDYRQNFEQSLNATIDTMTEFAMDDVHAGWDADLRGFDYNTDVKGTVKVVSALHPLATSLIQDDPEVYRLRALPITEFLMSRTKYLVQRAARQPRPECGSRHEGSRRRSRRAGRAVSNVARPEPGVPSLRARACRQAAPAESVDGQRRCRLLGQARAVSPDGRQDTPQRRARLADKYIKARINTPQRDFSDVHLDAGGQFWSDFAPKFVELFELWQETKEPRYLAAAQAGARAYASYAWYYPRVPGGEITVDRGGAAPVGYFAAAADAKGIPTPEVTLPSWQVSQVGLIPEAQTTYHLNPATFLAHHAAYELRIAAAANDSFLHDAARSAIVGRYKSFPGYDINVTFSNVYARSDYLKRPFSNLTYNEVYFNHIWPHIALLTDYLMSDFETRSQGAIEFPARYAQGYAYLRSKVYGDRPGKFMGDDNVRLWMPETSRDQRRFASQLSDRLRQRPLLSGAQQRVDRRA